MVRYFLDGKWALSGTTALLFEARNINMQSKKLLNLLAPTSDQDGANKKYVDDKTIESFPTSLTSGSIPFSDGTNLAQDNDKLFWDNVNKRLGIGTSSPIAMIDVGGSTATPGITAATAITVDNNLINSMQFQNKSSGSNAQIRLLMKANGADYMSFTYPSSNFTSQSWFGVNKSTAGFLWTFASSGTPRHLCVGTISDADLILGSNNIERIRVESAGDVAAAKIKLTLEGGYAIKLTNKTGANSVRGEGCCVDLVTSNAVAQSATSASNVIGTFYESGIADGSEAWVVVSGIAPVRVDGNAVSRGDRLISSTATAGRAEANNTPAVAAHFTEWGHVLQDIAANGTGLMAAHYL
jgi:hypothetical protein